MTLGVNEDSHIGVEGELHVSGSIYGSSVSAEGIYAGNDLYIGGSSIGNMFDQIDTEIANLKNNKANTDYPEFAGRLKVIGNEEADVEVYSNPRGFSISMFSIYDVVTNTYTKADVQGMFSERISPADPAFSNAVLSVATGVSTNDLAALGELAELPVGSAAGTVGALLVALAAAVAALKRGKADKADIRYSAATLTIAGNAATLVDRAVNTLTTDTTVALTPPSATAGRVRDMLVVSTLSNGAGVTFAATDTGGAAVSYVTEDADALAAEDGINVYSLTEIAPGKFMVARKTLTAYTPATETSETTEEA